MFRTYKTKTKNKTQNNRRYKKKKFENRTFRDLIVLNITALFRQLCTQVIKFEVGKKMKFYFKTEKNHLFKNFYEKKISYFSDGLIFLY